MPCWDRLGEPNRPQMEHHSLVEQMLPCVHILSRRTTVAVPLCPLLRTLATKAIENGIRRRDLKPSTSFCRRTNASRPPRANTSMILFLRDDFWCQIRVTKNTIRPRSASCRIRRNVLRCPRIIRLWAHPERESVCSGSSTLGRGSPVFAGRLKSLVSTHRRCGCSRFQLQSLRTRSTSDWI